LSRPAQRGEALRRQLRRLVKVVFAYGQIWNEFMWPLVQVCARQRISVARRGEMAKPISCRTLTSTRKQAPDADPWRGALILMLAHAG
jgi:hypothetical protein